MGPGIYYDSLLAVPGVYLSPCVYLSPALIRSYTVPVFGKKKKKVTNRCNKNWELYKLVVIIKIKEVDHHFKCEL